MKFTNLFLDAHVLLFINQEVIYDLLEPQQTQPSPRQELANILTPSSAVFMDALDRKSFEREQYHIHKRENNIAFAGD